MSVFIDLAGVSGTAFFNLLTISGEDGGLGLDDVPCARPARSGGSAQLTSLLDRLLRTPRAIAVVENARRDDPGLRTTGILGMSDKNMGIFWLRWQPGIDVCRGDRNERSKRNICFENP